MMSALKWLDLRRLGFVALFLSLLTLTPINDPDYFWHLRTGQYLFELGALPSGDVFSYTHPGQPWILHEWLFELVLYGIHEVLGEFGIKLLVAVLTTATLMVSYSTAKKILGKQYPALFITLASLPIMAPCISPRPQLVTYLLFALYLRVLAGFKYSGENRSLIALPLLMVAWVNIHGGYAAGLLLLGLFTTCEWLVHLASHRDARQRQRLQQLAAVAAITLLSSLINPYFIGHWLYPFQVLDMEASRLYITEWHSPDFHLLINKVYLVLVFVFFTMTIYRKNHADVTELAIPSLFVLMGFVAIRHFPLAALALVPGLAIAFSQQPIPQMIPPRWLNYWSIRFSRRMHQGKDLGDKEYLFNWLLLLVIAAGLMIYYPVYHSKDLEKANAMVPVKATKFIQQAGIRGRMFHTYHYGGYLLYRLYPEQKVFIDGRADMYGDAFIKEYIDINSVNASWEKLFDKYQVDYVVIERDAALRQVLLARGDFKLVYDDEVNSVLLKNDPKFASIIAEFCKLPHQAMQP